MKRIAITFIFIISILKSHAQTPVYQEDSLFEMTIKELFSMQVEVSAPKETDFFDAPATITILDKELIEKYNFISIADALTMIAGVDILHTSIDQNVTTIRGVLQGFYANKILLLINNEPTWNAIYGEGYIERININDIERIEILKGPASVYYGTNAYAGVVNLILKKSDEPITVSARGISGINKFGETAINTTFNVKKWTFMLGYSNALKKEEPFELVSTTGFPYQGDSTFIYHSKTFTRTFTAAIKHKYHKVLFNNFTNEHTYHGAVPSFSTGGGELVSHNGYFINYTFQKNITASSFLKLSTTYDYYNRVHPYAADKRVAIVINDTRLASKGTLSHRVNELIQTVIGYDISQRLPNGHDSYDYIEDTLIDRNLSENNIQLLDVSTFFQSIIKYRTLKWHFGYRLSKNILLQQQNDEWKSIDKKFNLNHSFNNALIYKINKKMAIRALYGQSYRVPNIFELYFHSPPYVLGNIELTPEQSNSYELSFQTQIGNWYILPVIYYVQYTDLLVREQVPNEIYSIYHNSDSFDGHGTELELRYKNERIINFFLNYNFLNSDPTGQEKNYRFMPKHTISYGINKSFNKFYISTNGKLYSTIKGHINDIPPQLYLNLHAGYNTTINKVSIQHTFSLLNLTNSKTLISAYTRSRPNINTIQTVNGINFTYTLRMNF